MVILSNIYCTIDNCHYWSQGNVCKASEILVASDSWAEQTNDSIDAKAHMDIPSVSASSCMETCCKTFVPKDSSEVNVDGVTRN